VNGAQAAAELQKVIAMRHRGVILQFVVILLIRAGAAGASALGKRAQDSDGWAGTQRHLAGVFTQILETVSFTTLAESTWYR